MPPCPHYSTIIKQHQLCLCKLPLTRVEKRWYLNPNSPVCSRVKSSLYLFQTILAELLNTHNRNKSVIIRCHGDRRLSSGVYKSIHSCYTPFIRQCISTKPLADDSLLPDHILLGSRKTKIIWCWPDIIACYHLDTRSWKMLLRLTV